MKKSWLLLVSVLLIASCSKVQKKTGSCQDIIGNTATWFVIKGTETKHGLHTSFYPSGEKAREVNFVNGLSQGLVTSWYMDGQKSSEVTYVDGNRTGTEFGWHQNGQKQYEIPWVNNVKNGLQTEWHQNGQKLLEVIFVNDLMHGTFTKWDENGKIILQTKWVNGIEEVEKISIKGFYIGMPAEECLKLINGKYKAEFGFSSNIPFPVMGHDSISEAVIFVDNSILIPVSDGLGRPSRIAYLDSNKMVNELYLPSETIRKLYNSKDATGEQFVQALIDNIPALEGLAPLQDGRSWRSWETNNTELGVNFKVTEFQSITMKRIACDSEIDFGE